ncbi:zinc-binding oxidoreductase [Rhizodiscina lignyota]|uniref:Zinc-binding oxidoreductase n=1 Tax=Rhizodiscina lignyota TaxID=1504668 RepID=A0A9P4III1_9PEZI|nr:zinc-binding oxidoreductase [Rhizodiscina lignyota]
MASLTRKLYRRNIAGSSFSQRLALHEEHIPETLPTNTSILIKVHAISLNYRDANILNGTNPWATKADGIPCSDAAGEVISIGSHVTRFKIGDRVTPLLDQKSITGQEQEREWLGGEVDGVLATHLIFEQETVVKVPDHLSWAEAACLPNAGVTAWSALASGSSLPSGTTVVMQGTGGVSIMALKLARAAGCKVILTSSSDEKLQRVQKFAGIGQISTINYRTTPNWDEEVLRLNGGVGADIVLETGGTASVMRSIRATAKRGTVSQIGYLGKQDAADLDGLLPLVIDRTIFLKGINVGSRLDFEQMNKLISANGISFEEVIDQKYSFDRASDAFEYLWSGKHVGKVVIEL